MSTTNTSPRLTDFQVIDHLQVGPVRLEANRLSMPYTVWQDGRSETSELVYKYEEPVFDPADPGDLNLAGMIGAQPALNYGLFCKKITFDGLFDSTDQRFLLDMLENTSREIYVKKLLQPNAFLVEAFRGLPAVKLKSYTQAEIAFTNTAFGEQKLEWTHWSTDRHRHCVLSSGGKDSLLSYGLLREIGKEVHPVFGNESGRHWFTALNGYRHLRETDANTARVWMNSDRLFAWMLRHLPFIRPDFANLRADDYPVRLWTVAVFLFGALPLLKKRRIGRLVIGDEYDTTVRARHEGIPHYNGLYDQSRYFDEALSRFYLKKGWAVSQFSILRPVSELLIMQILLQRYPQLQRHQISCHAAHEHEGRIYPCGKCEKCRRIVGMLKALDGDPTLCGYTPEQIDHCLRELESKHIKQIGPDAAHLHHLLHEKGFLATPAKAHPEISKLRFDRERAHVGNMPVDLRARLYRIYLQYAAGAVRRHHHHWEAFDLLHDPEMIRPYAFEVMKRPAPGSTGQPPAGARSLHEAHLWGELTWEEAEEKLKTVDTALLPVGAIEQHGPHLPLDVDAFDADYLARKVAEACSPPRPLVLPLVPYGVSYHHNAFKGTISISNEAMARFIYDIGMSAARNGIKKLVIINGHGDNAPTLNYAAQMINRDAHIFVCVDTGETSDRDLEKIAETHNDIHAGEIETSTTLAVRPELVKMEKAKDATLRFTSRYLNFSDAQSVPWYAYTEKLTASGVMGNPTLADAAKGRRIWEIMIAHLVTFVEELKVMSLEEIHQRRY